MTFDATRRVVLRHQDGRAEQVGDDIFAALEEHIAADDGDPSVSWVGYLGYASRTDLPGRPADPASGVPDAVWMRVRDPWVFEHPESDGAVRTRRLEARCASRRAVSRPVRVSGRAVSAGTGRRSTGCSTSCAGATPTR